MQLKTSQSEQFSACLFSLPYVHCGEGFITFNCTGYFFCAQLKSYKPDSVGNLGFNNAAGQKLTNRIYSCKYIMFQYLMELPLSRIVYRVYLQVSL